MFTVDGGGFPVKHALTYCNNARDTFHGGGLEALAEAQKERRKWKIFLTAKRYILDHT